MVDALDGVYCYFIFDLSCYRWMPIKVKIMIVRNIAIIASFAERKTRNI